MIHEACDVRLQYKKTQINHGVVNLTLQNKKLTGSKMADHNKLIIRYFNWDHYKSKSRFFFQFH